MASNKDMDISLVAGLDESYSEQEILKVIKIIEKRLRANHDARIKLIAEIDDTVIKDTVNKLNNILKSKELKLDTKDSIQAITKEVNALADVAKVAKKAATEKVEFTKANEKLRESAEDSADAINRERTAMESLGSVDDILNNINARGRQGVSIFQQWDDTIQDAFMAYTAANLLERALDGIVDAGREAIEVVRDLNGEIVDLRMSTGDSYGDTKKLLSDYNALGQELGAITQDVSSAASDWLRQGHNIDDTNKLIRASMILSKISQMDSASATEYLTSSMKGYHVAVEDVIGIVDKLCTVDLSAAVSADGLANGMSRVAGVAESAGISMDKLLGYLAVIGETTQLNMGSVGNALKTIFLRMQDIKSGKLELIDEDGTVELLSDVETTLKNVGIDLRATVNEFNNSGEVLDSLAEKWDTLSSVQQAALQKTFSGQRQGNMFRVLMENYETAKKYMDIASESAGASEEKFGFYLESLESKTNSLIASLQNLASTTISDELYASILDVSKSIVDTTAETGLLKGSLIGLSTAGSLYAFRQIATYVRDAAQGFSDLSEAMTMTRGETIDMQRLIDLTSGLSQSQTRLLLSTNNLTDAQRISILTQQNLSRGMNRDLAEATARATLNNMHLTTSTVTLTGVMRGLWQTLLAHPYMIIATAISALTMAYHNYNQKLEETRQKNLEASEKAVEQANSLKDLYTEYSRLSSIQERTTSQEEEFKNIVEDITEKLGDKAKVLEGLTSGTNEYAEALANVTKEELQSASVEATIGRKSAEEDLQEDIWSDLKGSKITVDSNSKGKALSDEAQKAVDIVSDSLKEFETINRTWNNLSWDVTSDSPEEALAYYNALVQAREKLVLASEDDESLLETEVYKDLNSAITTMSDSLEDYISKKYEEEKLLYMAQNGIPQTVEEYKAMKIAMEEVAGSSEGLKSKFNDLLTADFSGLANSMNEVVTSGEYVADSVATFNVEVFKSTIQSYEEGYSKLISAQEKWNEAKAVSAETFADLQESGLLEYIEFTSDGLIINKEKLLENAQATKDKAVADLHASMMADMLKIALGDVDNASEGAKSVIAQLGDNTEIAGKQALSSVENWATLGATITDVMARARGEDRGFNGINSEQKKQMASVYDYYKNLAKNVSAIDITTTVRTKSGSSKSSKKSEKDNTKILDLVEIRIEKINDAIDLLKSNLDNVQGSFAKNALINAEIGLNSEMVNDYTNSLAIYTQKANEALSIFPSDIAEKIKNGAVEIVEYMDDSNGSISEAISNYQKWNDKVVDVKNQLSELKQTLEDLELQKFNNIVEDFTNQFDILETGKGWADKQISLFEEMGLFIGESFYLSQIEQTKKQLVLLEEQKSQLLKQLESAISSGRVEKGSEAWLSMIDTIGKLENQIISCKENTEQFSNALLEVSDKVFKEIIDRFDSLHNELESLEGLFKDYDVSDGAGNWSKEGLARLGLLAQNLELSLHEVQKYNEQIELLNKNYAEGKYSALEYAEKLSALKESQLQAVESTEAIKNSIVDLNTQLVEESIEAIEKETDAFRKNIEAQIESIEKTEDLIQKRKELEGKTKDVSDIEKQLASVMHDDSAAGIARRKLLEDELRQAKEELADLERQNSVEEQKSGLNQSLSDYESEQNAEIQKLKDSLKDKESLISASLETVKQNSAIIGQEIQSMAEQHGISISDAIITSWQNGENAIASYGNTLSAGSSAFIRNVMGVENEVYSLQNQANDTADSLAWMFATRADNLVEQLMYSYNNEQVLNTMTNILKNSLVDTLERNYNVSGITNALNRITEAARAASDAINSIPTGSGTTISKPYTSTPHSGGGGGTHISTSHMQAFASGTKSAKGGIAITDEEGYELKLPKLANGNYSLVGEGTQILTAKQTEMLRKWAELNPVDIIPSSARNMVNDIQMKQPQVVSRNVNQPVNVHYDSLVTVNGDVNDTNHFIKQMTQTVRNELVDYTGDLAQALANGRSMPHKYEMKKAPYLLSNDSVYYGRK